MKKFISIVAVIAVVLFVIFIIQNAENVNLNLLIWSIEAPKALLMIICVSLGFLFGTAVFGFGSNKQSTKHEEKPTATPSKEI